MNLKYLLEGAVSINPILFALSLCDDSGCPARPPVEQNANSSCFRKSFWRLQTNAVSESAGASPIWQRRAGLGCGPSRPTGEVLCRAIVLDRVLIGDRVTTCLISTCKYSRR